jgi:hypothetical protein
MSPGQLTLTGPVTQKCCYASNTTRHYMNGTMYMIIRQIVALVSRVAGYENPV